MVRTQFPESWLWEELDLPPCSPNQLWWEHFICILLFRSIYKLNKSLNIIFCGNQDVLSRRWQYWTVLSGDPQMKTKEEVRKILWASVYIYNWFSKSWRD